MSNSLVEGIKELLRTVIMAAVSYLLTGSIISSIVQWLSGAALDMSAQIIVTGLITSILSGVDKWLHKANVRIPVVTPVLELKGLDSLKS